MPWHWVRKIAAEEMLRRVEARRMQISDEESFAREVWDAHLPS